MRKSYVREERGGWILGVYEKNAPARFEYGVPDSFRADLFQLDLDRIEEQYMAMIHRIPSSEDCGLKDDFNGPICYTPDGNPLVGPAPGLRNMWLAEGFSFGITAAGGTGYYLAQMMVEGEAEIDMASLDPKRYGDWMTTEFAARKNEECYEHVYILHHPDEERPACRPLRTSPAYDRQAARGAQFGFVNGWERPNYYAPMGFNDHDARSFRRGGWWQYAVEEAKAIREGVGLIDATAFTKHLVRGPGATQFLDWFTCNKLPKVGRINLTYALTGHGTTRTEYTIVRLAEDEYYLVSAGAWTAYDADYLRKAIEDKAPRVRLHRMPRRDHAMGRLRHRRAEIARRAERDRQGCRPRNRPVEQALSLAHDAQHRAWHVPGPRDPRGLYRRVGLGVASPDRDAELPLRPVGEGRRKARHETGRRAGAELAAAGEILSRLRQRTGPRRHAAGGRPAALRRPRQGLPRQGQRCRRPASGRNASPC